MESYDIRIRAYQYVLKGDVKEKLPEILLEIQHEIERKGVEYYFIQNSRRSEKIKIEDIKYIYKDVKNTIFVTADKEYHDRKPLKQVMETIKSRAFLFVDKGIIVNMDKIKRIEADEVVFNEEDKVHISRAKVQKVKSRLREYWRGVL